MDKANETSLSVYSVLVGFYPRIHRERFGEEMRQTFLSLLVEIDQTCTGSARSAARFSLWMRTLADWFVSILREHLTDPNRTTGLLEAPPDAPLPWKGVLLVLLPGLAFFIAQIGQLTGVDWFFYLVYRGAYFMMIPVLIVWIWKKRFPVWGLIPVGLLVKTVTDLLYSRYKLETIYGAATEAFYKLLPGKSVPMELLVQRKTIHFLATYENTAWWIIAILLFASIILFAIICQHRKRVWLPFAGFLGYILLVLTATILASLQIIQSFTQGSTSLILTWDSFIYLKQEFAYSLHYSGGFLLAIMIGAVLARRHGRLAMLLPMGYLMSSTVYGRMSDDWPVDNPDVLQFMVVVAVVALLYRFTVTLAGPLWIVRSASPVKRGRVGAVSLIVLILIQFGFNLYQIASGWEGPSFWMVFFREIKWQIIYLAGIGLAAVMYRDPTISDDLTSKYQTQPVPIKEP